MPALKSMVQHVLLAFGGVSTLIVTDTAAAQPVEEKERVVITGTRIVSEGAESPSPMQLITAEDIAASGAINIQEVLLKNPTFGAPALSRTNSNFLVSSAGVSTVDLRNLGTARTLVLVNGRRFVAGVPGSSAVDLNAIPTQFIERVEVLTGGASSLYGSDAVAGVVNIIYRKDFEGIGVDAQHGFSEQGDDKRTQASITIGTTSASGRSNLMGHIGYSKEGAVYSRDRDFAAVDQISRALLTGNPDDIFIAQRPFFSSFAPQGRIFFGPLTSGGAYSINRTFDRQGNIIPFSTNGPAGDGVGATGFNRSEFRTIAIPTERYLFAGRGEHALNEKHQLFFEGTYASTQTTSRLEPFPLSSADVFPATGGRLPAEFLVNGTLVANPLIPAALFSQMVDTDGDGARDYSFTRRMSEIGNRGNVADRDTFRVVAGLSGELPGTWRYEGFWGRGVTKEAQTSSGQVNVLNFRNALEVVADVNDVDGDGDTSEPICRDAHARAQGCVPANVFGFNSLSPAAAKYIAAPGSYSSLISQNLFGFVFTGEPWKLPAGPVGVAVGGEYRDEFSRAEFDALQAAGLNAGNAIPKEEGGFDVKELFAEVRVPVLKDAPFARNLNFTGAVRGAKYSTVGGTLSWNTGLEWAPTSDFKLRATRALATRAPNITELFQPPSQTFPTGLSDPCLGVTATTPGARADACRADPGVAANIAANGSFTLTQADIQGISGFNRGNPNLTEEKGSSITFGLVMTPKSIPALANVALTIDYFDIKIDDAIVPTPRQFILEQCYGGDSSFCQFIKRRPTAVGANSAGSIEFIDSAVTNSGGLETKGIDVTVAYSDNLGPGRLSGQLSWTYLIEGFVIPLPGAERDEFKGEIGAPRNKGFLQLGYKMNRFGVSTRLSYIGKSSLDDQFLNQFGLARGSVKVPSKTYTDLQFTYSPAKYVDFYIGVNNAFNEKAPPVISGLPGNVTGAETAADVYDAIGRRYYAGFRARM